MPKSLFRHFEAYENVHGIASKMEMVVDKNNLLSDTVARTRCMPGTDRGATVTNGEQRNSE